MGYNLIASKILQSIPSKTLSTFLISHLALHLCNLKTKRASLTFFKLAADK
jgi:hypothetical protein